MQGTDERVEPKTLCLLETTCASAPELKAPQQFRAKSSANEVSDNTRIESRKFLNITA